MKTETKGTIVVMVFGVIIGLAIALPMIKKEPQPVVAKAPSELDQCMDRHRWDTTAVNTSRMAIQMQSHRMGKGELAKYVSDYDAVKIVYCSGK